MGKEPEQKDTTISKIAEVMLDNKAVPKDSVGDQSHFEDLYEGLQSKEEIKKNLKKENQPK